MKNLLFLVVIFSGCSNPAISDIRNDDSTTEEITRYFGNNFMVERIQDSTITYWGNWESNIIPIKIGKGYKNFLNLHLKSKEKFKLGDGSEIFEESNILIIRYDSTSHAQKDYNDNKNFKRSSISVIRDSTIIYSTFQNPYHILSYPRYSNERIISFFSAPY